MRIAIDVSSIKKHKGRGIEVYTENLVNELKKLENKNLVFELLEREQGKQQIKNFDLIHCPSFDFFWLTLPLIKRTPTVVTIHDVVPLIFPNKFPKGLRGWLKLQVQKFSLHNVQAIITDSENSKKDIISFLNVPKKKIHVIHLAPTLTDNHKANKNINLPKKFVLYVGDIYWNKNIIGLIRAFSQVKKFQRDRQEVQDLKLVLVGSAFLKSTVEAQEIKSLIEKLGLADDIKMTGFVKAEDLRSIYKLATLYCQPSFYEGFGLPVLDALALGCPVVCSRSSCLPEVVGKAAIFIDPYNIYSIAKGIQSLLDHKKEREILIKKGRQKASQYSWQETARKTIMVYKQVVDKKG